MSESCTIVLLHIGLIKAVFDALEHNIAIKKTEALTSLASKCFSKA